MFKTPIKRGNLVKKIIFSLIVFCFAFYPVMVNASSIADKQRELNALKKQIEEQGNLAEQKRKEVKTLSNEIAAMDGEIRETELAVQATKLDISKTNDEINIQEAELTRQKRILNESIRLMYEEKETSLLETLLSSESFSKVLDRMEYLNVVKNKIDSTIKEVNEIKNDLVTKKKSLDILRLQQEAQAAALNSQRAEKDRILTQTQGQEALYQQMLANTKAEYSQTKSEMEEMERSNYSIGGSYDGPPSPFGFSWPMADHSRNCHCYPSYPGHTGLDIGGPSGTPIFASADGEIIDVHNEHPNNFNTYGIRLDYGNYVKIQHSGNFQTLYAHLLNSSGLLNVYPGKRINRGEQIGFLGNTGCSSGPHLHFEIRYNGRPVNPVPYLP